MSSAYFASTEHLNLRGQQECDLDLLFDLFNDPAVLRGPGYVVPSGPGMRNKLKEIGDKSLIFIIIESKEPLSKEDATDSNGGTDQTKGDAADSLKDRWVGLVGLTTALPKNRDAELAIGLDAKWRGRGYGTEVMRWLVDYAFENLGLHRISLQTMVDNYPAIALYKSTGFVQEGRTRKAVWENGGWTDMISMGLLYEDWLAAKSEQTRGGTE